jgi:hypothetical protein
MKIAKKIIAIVSIVALLQFTLSHADNKDRTPAQMKTWLQEALHYGFDMKTQDYTKYMSKDYIEHIDGKVFNFQQWLHHMTGLKEIMSSYTLSFDEIMAEGNQIAASYVVHANKKDGSKLDIRIIAIFKIKDGKMYYCDELTHMIAGNETDKNLGSQD